MKNGLKLITIVLLYSCISACTKNDQFYEGFLQGIYEISNQSHEERNSENTPAFDENSPTYYKYKKEREEMLNGSEKSGFQQ